MKILGIDQGIANIGYGMLNNEDLINYGYITTNSKNTIEKRIYKIREALIEIVKRENPDVLVCEKLFYSPMQGGRNKSASIVNTNMVTGIIASIAGEFDIEFVTYVPGQVKKEITGNGKATKEMVIDEINKLYTIVTAKTKAEHVCDGISLALTHHKKITSQNMQKEKKPKAKKKRQTKNTQ